MNLDIYQIDAFARGPFSGNPAAVVPLNEWLTDETLQSIAEENNLSETAYFIKTDEGYHIRWFTPLIEVNLCGHATLASAHVIFKHLGHQEDEIVFHSKSGKLSVKKAGEGYTLNFPTDKYIKIDPIKDITTALGDSPMEWYKGRDDIMLIFESQDQIENMNPDFGALAKLEGRGYLVTAKGKDEFDFVSRGFFPRAGVNEDPATGSAHTTLTPYWSKRLNQLELTACQLSDRKGYFHCIDLCERTQISGKCNDYLVGRLSI